MSRAVDGRIASLTAEQAGRVARHQLIADGIGEGAIDRRIASGSLRPVLPGVYAVGPVSTWLSALWAAYLYGGPDCVLTHRSAAVLWQIASFRQHDISLPARRFGTRGLVCHRLALPPTEVVTRHGLPVTTPARTLLDLASILPEPRLQPIFTEAEVQGRVDQHSIRALLARHRRSKGAVLLRRLAGIEAGHIRQGRVRSRLEIGLRRIWERHPAWPEVEFNTRLLLGNEVVEVDALVRSARLAIELDHRSTHDNSERFHADRERDRRLLAHSYRALRITDRHTDAPGRLEADLDAIFAANGAITGAA